MFSTPLGLHLNTAPSSSATPISRYTKPGDNHHYHEQQEPHQSSKRPVSSSKRAAQNRAAQRAFRQRKDQYIKGLEKRVQQLDQWGLELEWLRKENKFLLETIHELEKRLIQLTGQPLPQDHHYVPKHLFSSFTPILLRKPQDVGKFMIPWSASQAMTIQNDAMDDRRSYG
ncbi:hypothetical protein EC973_002974 [Apophysomyces ossiformis]|uniref:Putative transcription factor kapC n=1 Tax=Apophysomyces ossiformis TaxID=679940 RepID=A0A8H7BN05_9FUNG|nr:hypothetical protein EC973_002974 [Apophysomyces ossiformis]